LVRHAAGFTDFGSESTADSGYSGVPASRTCLTQPFVSLIEKHACLAQGVGSLGVCAGATGFRSSVNRLKKLFRGLK
jgi:hypothetical protein